MHNKTVYFSLPADKPYCRVMLSVRYIRGGGGVKVKNDRFDSNGLYHLIQGDRLTSKGKITSFKCNTMGMITSTRSTNRYLARSRVSLIACRAVPIITAAA